MTIGKLYNPQNVVVGQAALLVAPANTPLPPFNLWNTADPFDLNFWNAVTGWSPIGGTEQGWSSNFNKTTQDIQIEEQSIPVAQTITVQNIQFNGSLAEDSSQSLAVSLNALKTAVAATAAVSLGTTGGSALSTGAPITSITLAANNSAAIPPNSPITLTSGGNTQTFLSSNTSTIAATSTTTIPVQSLTPNFAYPTGSAVAIGAMPGFDQLTLQDTPLGYAAALTTVNEKGFGRLMYAPYMTQVSASATAYRRAAALRAHPVTFTSLCQPSQIGIFNFTAVHA
ncbi:MAG: hypothetical protein ACM3UO_00190 [Bacillota bacterium]